MENIIKRVNIGCGQTPTPGWHNIDNSYSIRLAKHPSLITVLEKLGLVGEGQRNFASYATRSNILWGDATKRIQFPDDFVEAIYTSHMIEHLDRQESIAFLKEAHRILAPRGVIRVAVPDLRKLVYQYLVEGDADSFIEKTLLTRNRPKALIEKLKYLVIGDRHHLWMYDGQSMIRTLYMLGFSRPQILDPGRTMIPDPGELDLYERADESVYVEAYK